MKPTGHHSDRSITEAPDFQAPFTPLPSFCFMAGWFCLLQLFFIAVTATTLRVPYDYGIDRDTLVKRQDSSLILTGVHSSDGSIGIRREVRDLEEDSITWALYLLGLDWMQSLDQDGENSWYQLMGDFFFFFFFFFSDIVQV
jgi:hypothetical protein